MIERRFKLYPDCHWVYFEVFIHSSQRAMNLHTQNPKNVAGLCKGWLTMLIPKKGSKEPERIKAKIGEIHLSRQKCTVGISTHEICHAVHRYLWVRRQLKLGYGMSHYRPARGDNLADHREESFCWVMGNMYRQFCIHFHQRVRKWKPDLDSTISPIPKHGIA